jgi:hypothetical protein
VEENSTAEQSVRKAKSTTVIGVLKWRCKAGAVLQALQRECECMAYLPNAPASRPRGAMIYTFQALAVPFRGNSEAFGAIMWY